MAVPTPHIAAEKSQIAPSVLMPGDPLRSKWIAGTFLEQAELVNDIRGVQGYTGLYQGVPVTVMASGMGIPSIALYSYELYHFYDVERIIRVGTAGALADHLKVRDLVLGLGACTTSRFCEQYHLDGTFAPIASWPLAQRCMQEAERMGLLPAVGNLLSADVYYDDDPEALARWKRMGVLAVEMEAAGLYATAARAGKEALCICTVSNSIATGEELDPALREHSFAEMAELALRTAVSMQTGGADGMDDPDES